MIARLSFRYKLPLALVATAMLTALVLGAVMLGYGYMNAREALVRHARELADALVATARPALRNDDIWAAYTTLRGGAPMTGSTDSHRELRVLVDTRGRVLAANRPERFPVGRDVGADPRALPHLAGWLRAEGIPDRPRLLDRSLEGGWIILVTPVLSETRAIGALILAYPASRLTAGFQAQALQGGAAILGVLALIVPFGWCLGHRIASPLTQLTTRLSSLGGGNPDSGSRRAGTAAADEIDQLQRAYAAMRRDLDKKTALERQVIVSERLAAIGRLTASVAHEVNNPLGGMLIAVDTLRRTEAGNARVERTTALLQRGLEQIQQTVSALLVQARLEDRMLTAEDLDDLRTLIASRLEDPRITVEWEVLFPGQLPVPATPVRQIMINLVLNAIDAVRPPDGRVLCRAAPHGDTLLILVEDNGRSVPPAFMDQLFEPFSGLRSEGTGMGLWITYQLVSQLGGTLAVESAEGRTCFRVSLPLDPATDIRHERTGT